jgi:hypothetical protein
MTKSEIEVVTEREKADTDGLQFECCSLLLER